MGRAISAFEGRVLVLKGERRLRLTGLFLAAALPTLSFVLTRLALHLTPPKLRRLLEVGLLSTALSMRGLARSALAVERELDRGDLEMARTRVKELVGRDTERLPPGEVARAAVESVAENTSDGAVAPMLYGLFFGAPGALAYRAVNTLDSMVGYRREPYAELGWASARVEAAFAGALGLRLGGSNAYGGVVRKGPILGEGRRPGPDDIRRSVRLM